MLRTKQLLELHQTLFPHPIYGKKWSGYARLLWYSLKYISILLSMVNTWYRPSFCVHIACGSIVYWPPIQSMVQLKKFSLSTPINTLWEEFRTLCANCIPTVPTKPTCTSWKQPWISSHIRRLSCKKQHLYKALQSDLIVQTNGKHTETLRR